MHVYKWTDEAYLEHVIDVFVSLSLSLSLSLYNTYIIHIMYVRVDR
jgi:hypothetical protein